MIECRVTSELVVLQYELTIILLMEATDFMLFSIFLFFSILNAFYNVKKIILLTSEILQLGKYIRFTLIRYVISIPPLLEYIFL